MLTGNCQALAAEKPVSAPIRFQFQQIRMGVPWRIEFYADSEQIAIDAQKAAFARVKKLDLILSDYDPDSELNRLCSQAIAGQAVSISEDLFKVLQASQQISHKTGGAFDVTVGHLTDLWRRAYRKQSLPVAEALRAALEKTDYRLYELNEAEWTVTFLKNDLQLDLGGIAKGYAADEAMSVLKTHGIKSALIDASGDIVVSNAPPEKEAWIIAIAPLRKSDNDPEVYLKLVNCSVATSGDASRYVEIDGVRYSHIVNPVTGLGLTTPSSVTIIAQTGITADALASAISVMGPKTGFCVLKKEHAEAYVVIGGKEKPEVFQTEGFPEY
ncbi:Thiamine biosynthesis lipoprotein ApbE precursor [Rubinisphaera italica]|uniref:FAD:protein FMN transferase n=1 Tax=Rubinisphaera italica TaxID=2527969 RepID=A0A5C5XKF3_9PLAN|nr:Thiamine biosynthesis lipoprotein ApbE precursor [Rubinisphaera italica]